MDVLKKWMKEVNETVIDPDVDEGLSDEGERDVSLSMAPSTGATLNGYNDATDTAITSPITGSQAAVDNGYYEPERRAFFSSMNYNDDCRNSFLESDPTTALTDFYQVNSNEPNSLNDLNSFNEEFPSYYIDDVNHFRNGAF
jgi:hypothetical protein